MMHFLWTLFQGLLATFSFVASVLMLKRLWRLVPVPWRRRIRNGLAAILIVVGIIGSILPVMPGFVFLLLAFLILDVPHKRVALRRLQHSWVMQRCLRSPSFAKSWRRLRRYLKDPHEFIKQSDQTRAL
ncbi:YbaN family protein [Candidatus Acetothermia bacterium]|jgi:UPF0716 family protein affecting phage T7 exclusion|nr:YbaN family protein [Candidatus Acetothermia bacterium]MCI2431868.1 YbaN family protein [Candidatus Acetothermia bacterium]MCI2435965.1 YbaN family protein [Candidatus Acetothermia bacterium]